MRDLGSVKFFSMLNLKSGTDSKLITAFSTLDGGSFEFEVMSFGVKNAPATFQRHMTQEVLLGYLREFALMYLDDIISSWRWKRCWGVANHRTGFTMPVQTMSSGTIQR